MCEHSVLQFYVG